jgi:hypothetical protein
MASLATRFLPFRLTETLPDVQVLDVSSLEGRLELLDLITIVALVNILTGPIK